MSMLVATFESKISDFIATKTPAPTAADTPTQASTPTTTAAATATATYTSTYTATPVSAKSRYYMSVLDALHNMREPFGDGTQTKWDAALASVEDMRKALNDQANYGLVVASGQNDQVAFDPCNAPQVPLVPFTTSEGVLLLENGFPKQAGLNQLD